MNKQTKGLKKINVSCLRARGGNNTTPTFKEYPAGSQPSRRKTPWGQKLPQGSRDIIYPAEFAHKNKK